MGESKELMVTLGGEPTDMINGVELTPENLQKETVGELGTRYGEQFKNAVNFNNRSRNS